MGDGDKLDSWAVVELMGHVRMAGRLTEEEHCGGVMGRLDVPDGSGFTTTYFTASSVYRLTICSEEAARGVAARNRPEPVHRWELPKPDTDDDLVGVDRYDDDDGDDDGDYPL